MSKNARIGLIVAAAVIVVVGFVIFSGDDKTAKDEGAPVSATITLKNHAVVGGPKNITATKGDPIHIEVVSDKPDTIHLHGYDIEKEAKPGAPAEFDFKAKIDGNFEIESHTAEHLGKEPKIGSLTVNPS
jgi:hypothetical protein